MADAMFGSASKQIGTVGASWVSSYGSPGYNDTSTQFSASSGIYRDIGRDWGARHRELATPSDISSGTQANEPIGVQSTRPAVTPHSLTPSTVLVVGMHKWAGEIIAVEGEVLTAEFLPLDQEGPTFTADFDLKLLGPDYHLAKPGGTVYLTTRLIDNQSGYPEAMTNLRLRRPRRWSARELADTLKRARATAAAIQRHVGLPARQ
jgi:hypothetical protein